MMRSFGTAVFCLLTLSNATMLFAQSRDSLAQPGAVDVEPPTTGALGVEWRIQGDDNRNASVAVAWRRTGETAWRDGLPLLRLQAEAVQQGASFHYVAPNMFAGSVFDLEPNTSYDLRLRLTDPDAPARTAPIIVNVALPRRADAHGGTQIERLAAAVDVDDDHDYATLKRGNKRSALPRSIICSNARGSFRPGS